MKSDNELNKKIRILFLFYADPYLVKFTGGGLASYILMYLASLDKMFDVYVVSTQYFAMRARLNVTSISIFKGLPHKINFALWIFKSILYSLKIVKKYKIDVIIGGGITSPATLIPVYLLKMILGRRIHSISFNQLPALYIRHKLYSMLLEKMDAIICSTNIVKRSLKGIGIKKPMFMIGYGISTLSKNARIAKDKDIDCIFLGRITREKGGLDLIKIAKLVVGKRPNTSFVAVGEVDSEILKLAKKAKAPIKFVGFAKRDEVWEYLARSRVMVYPSRYDSFAISVAEAMMAGLPVITWNIPPFNEEYSGSGLIMIEPFNHATFSEEIIKILENPVKAKMLGEKNREYAQKFKWINVYKNFKKAVLKCLLSI